MAPAIFARGAPARAENAAEGDGVKGYPTLAPYSGVRWDGSAPQVELDGKWYGLVAIDRLSAATIVEFCQRRYQDRWQKRFEEDLVAVMSQMGARPADTVTLALRGLDDQGAPITRDRVPMTRVNRQAIWRANQRRAAQP